MDVVVVLSGGQDSALCLALAVKKHGAENVAAITFAYGQRHAIELKYAKKLAKHFGVTRHNVVRLDFYPQITSNALMTPGAKILTSHPAPCTLHPAPCTPHPAPCTPHPAPCTPHPAPCTPHPAPCTPHPAPCTPHPAPPNTVVEGRNAIFLQIAAVWAKSLGASEVYTGVSQTDYSGYPDCRAPFVRAQQKAIRLALDYPIRIVTPFMYKTKAEEWALADKLGILEFINENTVTCYDGIPGGGCGKCPACRLRNRGLAEYRRRAGR